MIPLRNLSVSLCLMDCTALSSTVPASSCALARVPSSVVDDESDEDRSRFRRMVEMSHQDISDDEFRFLKTWWMRWRQIWP